MHWLKNGLDNETGLSAFIVILIFSLILFIRTNLVLWIIIGVLVGVVVIMLVLVSKKSGVLFGKSKNVEVRKENNSAKTKFEKYDTGRDFNQW